MRASARVLGAGIYVSLGLGLGLGGCARSYLTWTPREPLAARRGKLAVTVDDRRPGLRHVVGRGVGFGGVPRPLELPADEPRLRIDRLAREAAATAGIALAAPADAPSARLLVALEDLACDGEALTARAELRATISIGSADGATSLQPDALVLRGKGRACDRAFADTLDQLLDELAARLVEGPWHEAALGRTGS